MAAWALGSLPLVQRKDNPLARSEGIEDFLASALTLKDDENQKGGVGRVAALVAGYYIRTPWSDGELMKLCAGEREGNFAFGTTLRDLLAALKSEGEQQLCEVNEREPDQMR